MRNVPADIEIIGEKQLYNASSLILMTSFIKTCYIVMHEIYLQYPFSIVETSSRFAMEANVSMVRVSSAEALQWIDATT